MARSLRALAARSPITGGRARTTLRLSALALLAALPLVAGCEHMDGSSGSSSAAASGDSAVIPAERMVTVGRGDSVYLIAKRYAVPMRELIALNQLKPPYPLEIGQRLRLPTDRAYTVASGDSLSRLAQRFQMAPAELARLNHIEPPYGLRVGQVLVLPPEGGAQLAAAPVPPHKPEPGDLNPVHGAVQTAPLAPPPPARSAAAAHPQPMTTSQSQGARSLAAVPAARRPEPAAETQAAASPASAPVAAKSAPSVAAPAARPPTPAPTAAPASVKAAAPAAAEAEAPAAPGGKLLWPVQGKVISDYGDKPDGRHNDGLNIAAAKGSAVIAADNGVVAYVGNELRGYGNLLLIRHSGGLMTAYAHLDRALVERGATVRRGQKIGTVGATGTVTAPQLHFEVRRGSQAVDPGAYMDVPRQATDAGTTRGTDG